MPGWRSLAVLLALLGQPAACTVSVEREFTIRTHGTAAPASAPASGPP